MMIDTTGSSGTATVSAEAPSPRKVVLVAEDADPARGGMQVWLAAFRRHLEAAGHAVHIVCFGAAPDRDAGVQVLPLPSTQGGRTAALQRAVDRLRADLVYDTGTGVRADLLHPHSGSNLHSERRYLSAAPLPLRVRAAVHPYSVRRRAGMARLEAAQLDQARRVVVGSRLVRDVLRQRYGTVADKAVVVHNGADPRFLDVGPMPDGPPVLAQVAHNLRLKGVDTALRALARLRAGGVPAMLRVAGGLPDAGLLRLVRRLGLSAHVAFLGPLVDTAPLLAAAHAVVHPTRWDACSLAALEGMAAARPVITTACDGAAERINNGDDGMILPEPEDVYGLAAMMAWTLHPDVAKAMGARARAAAITHDLPASVAAVARLLLHGDAVAARAPATVAA